MLCWISLSNCVCVHECVCVYTYRFVWMCVHLILFSNYNNNPSSEMNFRGLCVCVSPKVDNIFLHDYVLSNTNFPQHCRHGEKNAKKWEQANDRPCHHWGAKVYNRKRISLTFLVCFLKRLYIFWPLCPPTTPTIPSALPLQQHPFRY